MTHDRPSLDNRLVVVANRLPIEPGPDGWRRSLGGLVTAVAPMVAAERGAWVGWNEAGHDVPSPHAGMRLCPIDLPRSLSAGYYNGFANSTIWPIYHDCLVPPEFQPSWWAAYRRVNQIFAGVAARAASRRGTVWVHDYHLQLVPSLVRRARGDVRIGFFLHVPVPGRAAFDQLPHGAEILRGILGADVVGVQRPSDAVALQRLAHDVLGLEVGDGTVRYRDRTVEVRAFPASVDLAAIEALSDAAVSSGAVAAVRARLGQPRTLILGVERLDYTKGVEQRLEAFRSLLATGRVRAGETVLLQVLAPSRLGIARYRDLRDRIATLVAQINADFGPAVEYWDRPLPIEELVPLYRAADVMAVTPLRDGMNLVAKEFVASRTDLGGRLLLSRFAGAADELRQAVLVDPTDPTSLQNALMRAIVMPTDEARRRMRQLRACFVGHDATQWGQEIRVHIERSRQPVAVGLDREPAAAPIRRHRLSTVDSRG